jgi:hypothetical protein
MRPVPAKSASAGPVPGPVIVAAGAAGPLLRLFTLKGS